MRQSSFISGFGMLKGVNNFINFPVEHQSSKAFTWSSRRVETPNKSSSCTTVFDHQICLMQFIFSHCVYSLSRNIVWNPFERQLCFDFSNHYGRAKLNNIFVVYKFASSKAITVLVIFIRIENR